MRREVTWALLADGRSDRALVPIIELAMREHLRAFTTRLTEFRVHDTRVDVARSVRDAAVGMVADLMFVHRDAERQSLDVRRAEIGRPRGGCVRVVPVRMTEAWLLVDEPAIRSAAENPRGTHDLGIPPLRRLESLPDPKRELRNALICAYGDHGVRRREQFERRLPDKSVIVAERIAGTGALRKLSSFAAFEADLLAAVRELGIL
ncbi:MAG: hypothetical protein HMLKMBBP_03160 [Planctomycetes bacterium]|nr:hypothetical protein [Planctomycetota bacterium]